MIREDYHVKITIATQIVARHRAFQLQILGTGMPPN
jgi:hypothetical protein